MGIDDQFLYERSILNISDISLTQKITILHEIFLIFYK